MSKDQQLIELVRQVMQAKESGASVEEGFNQIRTCIGDLKEEIVEETKHKLKGNVMDVVLTSTIGELKKNLERVFNGSNN